MTLRMDYSVQVSKRINDLVEGKVITIGVHISSTGKEVWARFSQPHKRLGITTHESYDLTEAERLAAKIVILTPKEPYKVESTKTAAAHATQAGGSLGFPPLDEAIKIGSSEEMKYVLRGGLKNYIAVDSLVPADFKRDDRELFARMASVCDRLGTSKLVSRINTQRTTLEVVGAANLREWWFGATARQKLYLTCRAKHFPSNGEGLIRFNMNQLAKLDKLPCPFRNAEAQVGRPEEGASAYEEQSSSEETPEETGAYLTAW